MKLRFQPFNEFIRRYTIKKIQANAYSVDIVDIKIGKDFISAIASGSKLYDIKINYNQKLVGKVSCTCPYDHGGYCKHIIATLMEADYIVSEMNESGGNQFETANNNLELFEDYKLPELLYNAETNEYKIENQKVLGITHPLIKHLSVKNNPMRINFNEIRNGFIFPNKIKFEFRNPFVNYEDFSIEQRNEDIILTCTCMKNASKLCEHLSFGLSKIQSDEWYRMAFDAEMRAKKLNQQAKQIGLGNLPLEELDELFEISLNFGRVYIIPKIKILSLSKNDRQKLRKDLLPTFTFPKQKKVEKQEFILVTDSSYYDEFTFSLMNAPLKQNGEIKSPIEEVLPQLMLKNAKNVDETKFYGAFLIQESYIDEDLIEEGESYMDIIKNPKNLPIYYYEEDYGYGKITPQKIKPITFENKPIELSILVKEKENFYVLSCNVKINNKQYTSDKFNVKGSFFKSGQKLYFINQSVTVKVLDFFEKNNHIIYIHSSQFDSFKSEFLETLENTVTVRYDFVKKATQKIIKENNLGKITGRKIYLSESESEEYVLISPVMAYGDREVPILSKRMIYADAPDGTLYFVERNEREEVKFLTLVQEQHPIFAEYPNTDFFYLHKQVFLEDGWFLDAFENWQANKVEIFGFKELKNNLWNANKMKVQTTVNSGIDWFDVKAKVSFGDQEVSLKDIQKSIHNKNRFVKLGDGTQGLLPQEWIDKFGHYFRSAEIKDDFLRVHKSNFSLIDEWFEEEVLSEDTRLELRNYKSKLADFKMIKSVKIPKKLKAELRDYQKEGLNWLHFLDEFGFGGILADDMGLGKTIQILTYILSQIEKGNKAPNLIVVPTSLLFNWEREIKKFTPTLKYVLLYGIQRDIDNLKFESYNLIITTYGTMLSDIEKLKEKEFNLVVLDESQAIKNPSSKRYKAVRLLKGRQKIAMTGTPVENNTFDLFAQLSFVMPGLLGSAKHFKDNYSILIDKYQDDKIAEELQKKVYPFILRRTKKQVATELPEKTEMIINCEMGKEQRRVYDVYKKEFQDYLDKSTEKDLKKSTLHILQGLTKLRQICNSPSLLSDKEFYGEESSKLDELLTQIDILKGEHKIIVFSQFVKMLELIKARLDKEKIQYSYLTGQTRNREEQVEEFQNNDEVRVFLISLKAGGTGLNLTEAEYVFIVDPWWNPAVENQAIDRAYRIGQKRNVTAIRLIVPDTIEEKIMLLQERKRQLADDLIHVDTDVVKSLNKKDLMEML